MKLSKLERLPKAPPPPTKQKHIRRFLTKVSWIKVLTPVVALGVLIFVVMNVPPPKSILESTPDQILLFFGPLLIFLVSLINLLFKFLARSIIISLGIVALLITKAFDALTFLNILGICIVVFLLIRIVKKSNDPKIPNKIPRVQQLRKQ